MSLYHNGNRHHLDAIDWAILEEIQRDARISYSELGRRLNLSAPATQERIRKLEDAGIIKGYHATLDLERLGLPIRALVQLNGKCSESESFIQAIEDFPQVLQCHHVLGDTCFYLVIAVPSMKQLETLLTRLKQFGETSTTVILSSPLEQAIITPENLG